MSLLWNGSSQGAYSALTTRSLERATAESDRCELPHGRGEALHDVAQGRRQEALHWRFPTISTSSEEDRGLEGIKGVVHIVYEERLHCGQGALLVEETVAPKRPAVCDGDREIDDILWLEHPCDRLAGEPPYIEGEDVIGNCRDSVRPRPSLRRHHLRLNRARL